MEARVATLPEGMDPDEFILKEGKAKLETLLAEQAREPLDYLLDTSLGATGGERPSATLVNECAQLLALFPDEIRYELALRRVCERLRFPEDVLRREARKAKALKPRDSRDPLPDKVATEKQAIVRENAAPQVMDILGPHACAGEGFEVHLLEASFARPDAARGVAAEVRAEDFTRGPLREVASVVLRTARDASIGAGSAAGIDPVFHDRAPQPTGSGMPAVEGIVRRLLQRIEEHSGKAYDAELEGVRLLHGRRHKARLETLTREMAQANAENDWDEVERSSGRRPTSSEGALALPTRN